MWHFRICHRLSPLLAALPLLLASTSTEAGQILDRLRTRGELRCGVSEGMIGFSIRDSSGRWRGIDADFCRAVAAAVLGDATRVRFVPLKLSSRLPALQSRAIDLLVRYTSWTLTHEAQFNLQFPGVLYFDEQVFLVPRSSGILSASDLTGKIICVHKGTTSAQNLKDYLEAQNLQAKLFVIESGIEDLGPLLEGRCIAYSASLAILAAALLRIQDGAANFSFLPQRISTEMYGPVLMRGDDEWFSIVRLVLFALILAEDRGLTRANAELPVARKLAPAIRLFGELGKGPWQDLGLGEGWVLRVIKAVGNYGEIFERNLGQGSQLKLERGLNRLWTQGGLIMAPPIK